MDYTRIEFSAHAIQRMFERRIDATTVIDVVQHGETIAVYPDGTPCPSALLLGVHEGTPVHVVVARYAESGMDRIITVYIPDPELWSPDFKQRRAP